MKKVMFTTLLCALATTMTAQERDKYWVQADSLCAKLLTMDTHNHIDVPMTKEKLPGPRVDLRTAMSKAGMSAVGMTFAVDYVQPLAEGQEYERFVNAITAQDSILHWSGLRLTLNGKEMRQRFSEGEPVVIQCVEGGHFLEGDVARLQEAYDRGLRVFCLLHDNDANHPLGDVYTNQPRHGGLTQLGADAIRECERLGMLVDLAHCDSATIAMALQVATKPVLISHTGLSTRLGSNEFMGKMMRPRLITPAQARMVAAKGGVIGIWPHLASSPEEYASNIRAMVDIVGIDHVCIGTDSKITPEYQEITPEMKERFKKQQREHEHGQGDRPQGDRKGGGPMFPKKDPNAVNHEWQDQQDNFYHSVIRCLLREGFTAGEIEKIVSGNFCRVFSEATDK